MLDNTEQQQLWKSCSSSFSGFAIGMRQNIYEQEEAYEVERREFGAIKNRSEQRACQRKIIESGRLNVLD